jgi:hypothetical protein
MQIAMTARLGKSGLARVQRACAWQFRESLRCTLERVLVGRMNRQGDDPSTDAVLGAHCADGDASKRLDEESKVFRPAVRTHASPLWAERITRAVRLIWAYRLLKTRHPLHLSDSAFSRQVGGRQPSCFLFPETPAGASPCRTKPRN